MLKIRLREYTPTGVKGRVLPVTPGTLIYTHPLNATPTLKFALATRMAGKMPDDGFVVGVEYAVGNGRYQPVPEHDRFIMTEDSGDDVDQSKTVTFTGESYLTWLLAHTYLHWSSSAKNGQRTYTGAAGHYLNSMLTESRARGWGVVPNVSWAFSASVDSAGAAWSADEKETQSFALLTPLTKVLSGAVDSGLCDWTVVGMDLRLYRPGTLGQDRSELVLGASQQMERVPVKSDASKIATNLTIVPEKGNWGYLTAEGATSKYGRLEATMTVSGANTTAAAVKLAQPAAAALGKVAREESYEWTPAEGELTPWKDFQVGDQMTSRARGAKLVRRVIGLIAKDSGNGVTVQAIVGEKISSLQARILSRVGGGSVGGIIGGTGNTFPSTPGPLPLEPDRPDALTIASNTSRWADDGTAVSTVGLSWEAVTYAVDGSEIDIAEYEVWSRLPSGLLSYVTTVTGTTALVESWEPGRLRLVAVRARSTTGETSEFSLEVEVTPATPASVVPKPVTGLEEVSNVGAFTVAGPVATVELGWDPVTESLDDEPVTVSEYEVWADGAPLTRVSGTQVQVQVPSDLTVEYRVRARTGQGIAGDPSAPLEVTGAAPGTPSRAPSKPILTTGYGSVSARWDGTYTGGGTAGAHTVWVEARINDVPWARQGAALDRSGSALVTIGTVGDTVDVRLVAYDQLDRETGISATVSIEVAAIDGADILANSIEGNRIKAGSIEVDQLSPNVGETLNIFANEAVQIIVGRQDEQDTATSHALDLAEQADDRAQAATDAAAAAGATAAVASGQALVAATQAQDTAARLTAHQSVFRVTPTGAEVASTDGANVLALTPSGVQIIQAGTPASTWDAGRLIVNETVMNRAQLANHIAEKSGTRTIIRPI